VRKYDHRISTVLLVFLVAAIVIALPRDAIEQLLTPLAGVAMIGVVLLALAWAGFGREGKRRGPPSMR
jgi:hypothetical protein